MAVAFHALGPVVILLSALAASPAYGQRLSFGAIGGGYPTRDFKEYTRTYTFDFGQTPIQFVDAVVSKRGGYMVGLQTEIALTRRFSFNFGGIYKPLLYRNAPETRDGRIVAYSPAPVITWQFPLLAHYRFAGGHWQPFVEGGPSLRRAGNLNSSNPSVLGLTAGLGLERQWGRLKLSPRIRYTHWELDNSFSVQTEQNQLELLLGLGYATPELARPLGHRFSFGVMAVTNLTANMPRQQDTVYTPEFSFTSTTTSLHSTEVGPFVEVNVWRRLSVEANAIARKYRLLTRYSNIGATLPPYFSLRDETSQISNFWEIPVLAKYRLLTLGSARSIPIQTFVAMGPSFRTTKEVNGWQLSHLGTTAAAGLEFRWRQIRVAPELRFTHWGLGAAKSPFWEGPGSPIRRNQLQAMLGLSF